MDSSQLYQTLYSICNTAREPRLRGLYHEKAHLVATDGYKLARVKIAEMPARREGLTVSEDGTDLTLAHGPFPSNYRQHLMGNNRMLMTDPEKLLAAAMKMDIAGDRRPLEVDDILLRPTDLVPLMSLFWIYGEKPTITYRKAGNGYYVMMESDSVQTLLGSMVPSDHVPISINQALDLPGTRQNKAVAQPITQSAAQPVNEIRRELHIDIETYCDISLLDAGLYRYASDDSFQILLFAYAFDNDPVTVIDMASGEKIPPAVREALTDPDVVKTAWNAAFERVCLSKALYTTLPVQQWECSMVRAAMAGLPMSLDVAGRVLKLEEKKMAEGKALLRYFTMPCKATKGNGMRERNMPTDDFDKWRTFVDYCRRDVEVERNILRRTAGYEITRAERDLYVLDQQINDRGIMIDTLMVDNAVSMYDTYIKRLTEEASDLTSLDNPNSVSQLKDWLEETTGADVDSLSKEAISEMLRNTPSDEVTRVLQIRQEMARSSVSKYRAMQECVNLDSRIRGMFQYYGANRSGRWSGRLVQVQNLPQNHLKDLDLARRCVVENDLETLEMLFGNVPDTLSQLIRTAFIPAPGTTFYVADFSAIEARVIAWLADEAWRQEVFATHGKIYEASASQMFRVPISDVTKGSVLRQKGKIAELALGYQGSAGALEKMGASRMGLAGNELQGLVDAWRAANPNIVALWKEVDTAARAAVADGIPTMLRHGVSMEKRKQALLITLPSGRKLSYLRPRLSINRYNNGAVVYEGMNQTTKQWGEIETYGGKLVENIVQAIARDCLAYAMLQLDAKGFPIVMHVHDEVVIEHSPGEGVLQEICRIMGQEIPWAPGLLLRADGYQTDYYKKD